MFSASLKSFTCPTRALTPLAARPTSIATLSPSLVLESTFSRRTSVSLVVSPLVGRLLGDLAHPSLRSPDIAAGKEQTFGTLLARALSTIGGKLHYGHPDFLNAIFMTTRGGVSKAQKGLHLNEDIYAGMTAFGRGGRIKHTEYYQCGKVSASAFRA